MRQHCWIELFSDCDCEICYHPGKANVVADALSRKERVKPKRRGLDDMIEHRSDGTLYYLDRIWVPLKGDVRTLIMDEAHKSKYSVHPGADKMYYDLRDKYWWLGMKKDIAEYIKAWTQSAFIVDWLSKYETNFYICVRGALQVNRVWQSMQEAIGTQLDMSTTLGEVGDGSSLLVEFSYNNSYHSSVRCAPFEALYGRKCRSPIMWAELSNLEVFGWPNTASTFCCASEIDAKLNFVEEPVEILERGFKKP
ncbi:putative reverse transcriptase domain-containing protein [Tanacetum coccineum]